MINSLVTSSIEVGLRERSSFAHIANVGLAPSSPVTEAAWRSSNHGFSPSYGLGGVDVTPLIVGMGKAAQLARKHPPVYDKKVRPLRDTLEDGILNSVPGTERNSHKTQRLANTSNITFHGIESEALLILLDKEGICASSGSACLADSDEPSHVVKAMKPDSTASRQMIRFSLDVSNSTKEIEQAVTAVQDCVRALTGSY